MYYQIKQEKCVGCSACQVVCPMGCIAGAMKQKHHIDAYGCIACGACKKACNFGAVLLVDDEM